MSQWTLGGRTGARDSPVRPPGGSAQLTRVPCWRLVVCALPFPQWPPAGLTPHPTLTNLLHQQCSDPSPFALCIYHSSCYYPTHPCCFWLSMPESGAFYTYADVAWAVCPRMVKHGPAVGVRDTSWWQGVSRVQRLSGCGMQAGRAPEDRVQAAVCVEQQGGADRGASSEKREPKMGQK